MTKSTYSRRLAGCTDKGSQITSLPSESSSTKHVLNLSTWCCRCTQLTCVQPLADIMPATPATSAGGGGLFVKAQQA